jgi:hypothetical protein
MPPATGFSGIRRLKLDAIVLDRFNKFDILNVIEILMDLMHLRLRLRSSKPHTIQFNWGTVGSPKFLYK